MATMTSTRPEQRTGPPPPSPSGLARSLARSGSGEYFRIWIVNLLLTVATLGIYSAWAKTRRLQYFYRNTHLAGASFDFRGDPKAILRGRSWPCCCWWPTSTPSASRSKAGRGRGGRAAGRRCPS